MLSPSDAAFEERAPSMELQDWDDRCNLAGMDDAAAAGGGANPSRNSGCKALGSLGMALGFSQLNSNQNENKNPRMSLGKGSVEGSGPGEFQGCRIIEVP